MSDKVTENRDALSFREQVHALIFENKIISKRAIFTYKCIHVYARGYGSIKKIYTYPPPFRRRVRARCKHDMLDSRPGVTVLDYPPVQVTPRGNLKLVSSYPL